MTKSESEAAFAKWLDKCPHLFLRLEDSPDSFTYKFFKPKTHDNTSPPGSP